MVTECVVFCRHFSESSFQSLIYTGICEVSAHVVRVFNQSLADRWINGPRREGLDVLGELLAKRFGREGGGRDDNNRELLGHKALLRLIQVVRRHLPLV